MTNLIRTSLLISFLGIFFVGTTGCARQKKVSKINALESQIGVITEELARLDQSIQEIRGTAAQAQTGGQQESTGASSPAASSAGAGSPVYRTPSGFELPSANIQAALKNAGYYHGNVDGKIGHQTKEAVRAFQRDHDLEGDGVVGRRTWDKLKTYLSGAGAN